MLSTNSGDKCAFHAKCIALYFLLMPLNLFTISSGNSLLKYYGIFLMLICIFNVLKTKAGRIVIDSISATYLFFVLLCVVSVLYSIDRASSIDECISIVLNFMLVFMITLCDYSKYDLDVLYRAAVYSGIVILVCAFAFAGYSSSGRLTISMMGGSADQNQLNGYLFFMFAHCLNKILNGKHGVLDFILVSSVIIFAILTGSRGALLAEIIMAVLIVNINLKNSSKKTKTVLLFIAAVVVLVIIYNFAQPYIPDSIRQRFSGSSLVNSGGSERMYIWEALLDRFFNDSVLSMLFGHGIGTTALYNTFSNHVAHNLFLEILIGTGIIGLLVYLTFICKLVKCTYHYANKVICITLLGILALGMTISITTYKPLFNCFILAILFRNYDCSDNQDVYTKTIA